MCSMFDKFTDRGTRVVDTVLGKNKVTKTWVLWVSHYTYDAVGVAMLTLGQNEGVHKSSSDKLYDKGKDLKYRAATSDLRKDHWAVKQMSKPDLQSALTGLEVSKHS